MTTPTVVALCGSLRDGSYTRIALERALDAAEEAGAKTELLDLREFELPVFDPDEDDQGDSAALTRRVREADAVILGTPVYHGSYSSALKNALDYCGFDEFENTTVGLLAVAGGGSYASTLDHLRVVARTVHAWVLPHQVGIRNARNRIERVAPEGRRDDADGEARAEAVEYEFREAKLEERVAKLGRQAVEYANIEPRSVRAPPGESANADD